MHIPEPAIPLPIIIKDEKSPVEKHIALAECIARREAARLLNNQDAFFKKEIEKVLLMAYEAGVQKGMTVKNKIDSL